jgi:hypothetical protein
LSDLDGPPVPPDFIYEPSLSASLSLDDKSSSFNLDTNNDRFSENKRDTSDFIRSSGQTNKNVNKFSISEVSSSSKDNTSFDQIVARKNKEKYLEDQRKIQKVILFEIFFKT